MTNLNDTYLNGAKAFNNFYSMLHLAMLESMPDVEISGSGAWVWRGYRIDSYKDLAKGLFYCQIYTSDPNILMFKESYQFSKYKPIDPRDKKYKIKDGRYYHPFWMTLDLYKSRFFLFTASEQYAILRNFVSYASSQSLIWQKSEVRARPDITSKEFLHGNEKVSPNYISRPSGYDQVSIDYLSVLPLQEKLFGKFKGIVSSAFDNKFKWFRPNAHWSNWDFRGYRLKISSGDSADYVWEIHYNEPEKLTCYSYENNERKREGYFDIRSTKYFDQTDEQQSLLLKEFVKNTLGKIVP